MTDIGSHEEVLRLKRRIALELMNMVKRNENTDKETVWNIFNYFYNKLIEEEK